METNELKILWKTLSKEKLIDKELARENIERIITRKSSKTVEHLSKKLKRDFISNVVTSLLIVIVTLFASVFLNQRNQQLPIQGYLFLILVFCFYSIKSLSLYSKLKFLKLSFCTNSLLESLIKVKSSIEKISTKESILTYSALVLLTVFANILINNKSDFTNFSWNTLQGYVFIISIIYLISLPWAGNYLFRKRFSGIIDDINKSIQELNSEIE